MFGFWIELEQKKAMWVTKQVYKQRNENGDNQLLEKLFVLVVHDWKLNAIVDHNLLKSRKLARQNSMKNGRNLWGKIKRKMAESRFTQQKWKTNLQRGQKCRVKGA